MKVKKSHLIGLNVILALILGAAALRHTEAQVAPTATGPTKVAVCDIVKVLSEYKRAKDLADELNERTDKFKSEGKKRGEALEQLKMEMGGYTVGSKQHDKAMEKLRRGIIDMEIWSRMEKESLLRDHLRLTKEMFKQIKVTISEVAKEQNIDLVVQLEGGEIGGRDVTELIAQIDRRKVLYVNRKKIDITAAVLQKINEAYIAQPKKK
jgi:Skp family chaperone for outer membrane proteins